MMPVDVAVLTVIAPELDAAMGIFDAPKRSRTTQRTIVHEATLRSTLLGRDLRVVLVCIGGAGNPGAAAATQEIVAAYQPKAVLLMGIAAGIRDKVRVGEVVLSDRVVAYEPAALVRTKGRAAVQPRPEIDRTPHAMNQCVVHYRADGARLRQRFEAAGWRVPTAPPGREEEFRDHVATGVSAHSGTIASGEKLLKDPVKFEALRQIHGRVEAGEMEAAGFVEACRRANVPWLVVRGISDFGDSFKDDRFHAFASQTAATVLADFLAEGLDLVGDGATSARTSDVGGAPAFVCGHPIDRDADFVGREGEKERILDAVRIHQPIEILGEPRMGRSSMLRWAERNVPSERPVVRLEATRGMTPGGFVAALGRALKCAVSVDDESKEHAAAVALAGLPAMVLLVDDAETLVRHGRGFTGEFFSALRAQGERRKLLWVSASTRALYGLLEETGYGSEFLNNSQRVRVGALEDDAAKALAARCGKDAAGVRVEVGGFAWGLQWMGAELARGEAFAKVRDRFREQAEGIFARWWRSLDAEEQQRLMHCVRGVMTSSGMAARDRKVWRKLAQRGFVMEREEHFYLEGAAWREHVSEICE